MQNNVRVVQDQLTGLQTIPEDAKVNLQLSEVRSEIGQIKNSLTRLEEVILENPSKALAVPLLQKDIDNLRESYKSDLRTTKEEISRIYDQNKWFIGLMFTMAIGLLGLAITNFFQIRRER